MTGEAHPRFGVEFDWLAVDRNDAVALFSTAGYGPTPLPVLGNVELVDDAVARTGRLPNRCELEIDDEPEGDCSYLFAMARRGLYAYDWRNYDGPYDRIARPTRPLELGELPSVVRDAAALGRVAADFAVEAWLTIPYTHFD